MLCARYVIATIISVSTLGSQSRTSNRQPRRLQAYMNRRTNTIVSYPTKRPPSFFDCFVHLLDHVLNPRTIVDNIVFPNSLSGDLSRLTEGLHSVAGRWATPPTLPNNLLQLVRPPESKKWGTRTCHYTGVLYCVDYPGGGCHRAPTTSPDAPHQMRQD